jgi:two-component system sensor histidine kinase ChvG
LRTGSSAKASFLEQSEITELDAIASEFDHLVTSLKRAAEHVRHRAEDTAHALKTPIAIMRQTLQPLRGELAASNKRVERALEVMEQAVERLDNLVDEARLPDDPGVEEADPQSGRVDLSRLLRQMLRGYQELAEGRGIDLEVALPPGLTVAGSEAQIRAAIEAVLYDMIISSPPGRRIEVQLLRTSVKAEIAVAGDGPRIPHGYGHRIFDAGLAWNPKTDSANGGRSESGIGLGWARRKLQAMGGGMHVESAPGQGLLVFLDVPVIGAPPTGRQLRRTLVLGIQSGREKKGA